MLSRPWESKRFLSALLQLFRNFRVFPSKLQMSSFSINNTFVQFVRTTTFWHCSSDVYFVTFPLKVIYKLPTKTARLGRWFHKASTHRSSRSSYVSKDHSKKCNVLEHQCLSNKMLLYTYITSLIIAGFPSKIIMI